VLLDFDTLTTDLDDYKGGRRSLIRIATVESMVAAGPAAAIVEFRRQFPRVLFEVRMMPAPAVIDAVLRAEADIGLGFSPDPHPELTTKVLIREPLLLVALKDSDLELPATVTLSDLASLPLALPGPEFGFRRMIESACRKAGFDVEPVFSSNSFETLRDFVVRGGGCSVLPSRALRGKDNSRLQWAPIEDRRLGRTTVEVLVLRKRKISRVLRLFLDDLGKALDE
jgi:DNA-binding transcriptional LysR family regulator